MSQHSSPFRGIAPLVELTRVEWRIGRRAPVLRLALAIALLYGIAIGGEAGRGVAQAAYSAAEAACQYLGFTAIVWMSLVAVRESVLRTDVLVFSKPQPAERLALAKFLGAYLQLLAILLALFLGSAIGRLFNGGLQGFGAYGPQYARVAIVIGFAGSASYALALLLESALAGITVGLYWLLTLTGKAFLAKLYFPSYTQNLAAYAALAAAIVLLTLCLYGRARRGSASPALWAVVGAPLFALLSAWMFYVIVRDGHDPEVRLNPAIERMAEQDTGIGRRAPGFTLPDQNGKLTGLSDFPGKILVIALWSPADPDSVLLLDRLNEIRARYGGAGVQPIAITVCEDVGASAAYAQGEGLDYPVVTDWGTYNQARSSELSPLATAFRAGILPEVIITDRRRIVRASLSGVMAYDGEGLAQEIKDRLQAEPR